jgi:hypothetical protein
MFIIEQTLISVYIDNDGSLLSGDFKITAKQVTLFPIIAKYYMEF